MSYFFARFFLSLFFVFSLLSAALPLSADAALVPCGRSSGTVAEQAPCTICHVVIGGQGLIDYGLRIMTFAAIAVIVAMAIFYIVSTGDEGMMQTAKSGIKAALIGFAVMLAAWLIVNIVLTVLVNTEFLNGIKKDGAFTFSCDPNSSSAGTATGTTQQQTGGASPANNTSATGTTVSTEGAPCSGQDIDGAVKSGTCRYTSFCTALTGATACASGQKCCL
ncbi:MAG: hypothetical protein A2878_03350 [Candidatus Moranbacteria bacterium RIFCSPHIGHO2_01_FULL_54_31]|nr:MAG: hypothetical protein A2878_03350 [Candidatus Moranbacteria bacterium RIFCSPHIGHO2_01_FULL_54_31]